MTKELVRKRDEQLQWKSNDGCVLQEQEQWREEDGDGEDGEAEAEAEREIGVAVEEKMVREGADSLSTAELKALVRHRKLDPGGDVTVEKDTAGVGAEKGGGKAALRCSVRVQQLSRPKPAVVPPKAMAMTAAKHRRCEREARERKRQNDAVKRRGGSTRQLWDAGNQRSREWGLI